MTQAEKPLRADAARNRARVLAVAYETMAAEGLAVPIDEIARRAGVGAGTVYRHFPTKGSLIGAVVQDRLQLALALASKSTGCAGWSHAETGRTSLHSPWSSARNDVGTLDQ